MWKRLGHTISPRIKYIVYFLLPRFLNSPKHVMVTKLSSIPSAYFQFFFVGIRSVSIGFFLFGFSNFWLIIRPSRHRHPMMDRYKCDNEHKCNYVEKEKKCFNFIRIFFLGAKCQFLGNKVNSDDICSLSILILNTLQPNHNFSEV